MPKPFIRGTGYFFPSYRKRLSTLIAGAFAGIIISVGIGLNFELFYKSEITTVALIFFLSGFTGLLMGDIILHVLTRYEPNLIPHHTGRKRHEMTGHSNQLIETTDYRSLKNERLQVFGDKEKNGSSNSSNELPAC